MDSKYRECETTGDNSSDDVVDENVAVMRSGGDVVM